ncbi:MAG: alpha/beta hydrolase [Verrucomicrobiota bacterium]
MKLSTHLASLASGLFLALALTTTEGYSDESDQGDLLATMPKELRNVGTGIPIDYEPYELAKFTKHMDRYPAATPPKGSFNLHGELEFLGKNVFGIHWFIEIEGSVWHVVTAGYPHKSPILMIHGFPESWWGFKDQMVDLAKDYYVISVDQLGYGQSDKSLKQDLTHQGVAKSIVALMDTMKIDKFDLVSHDRGSCIADNMMAVPGVSERVKNWIRMQQSFNEPHGLPRPSHENLADAKNYKDGIMITATYNSAWVSMDFSPQHMDRIYKEFGTEGLPEAVAQTYDTSFDIELEYRMKHLIQHMTMPILFLQATEDPAQREEEYARSPDFVPDGHVQFVEANHFSATEAAHEVSEAIRDFIEGERPPKLIVD